MDHSAHLTAIAGPTASGKTARGVALARAIDAEIVSADSRQIYRRMDLGTGKDLDEYAGVRYHLIDIAEPGTRYDLHRFQADARRAMADITARGHRIIICGGSGLYLETLLSGIEMADVPRNDALRSDLEKKNIAELREILAGYGPLHNTTDTESPRRAIRAIEIAEYYATHPEAARAASKSEAVRPPHTIIGIDIPRDDRRRRIAERLDRRLINGMAEEVRGLLAEGITPENLIYYGLEYRYVTEYVTGRISREEMRDSLYTAICQFAKRQMTWLRGMERRGFHINWLPYDMPADEFIHAALSLIQSEE